MSKLPSILALAVTTSLLLVGCSTNPSGEPAAGTPSASDSPSPSETPTPEETESAEAEETAEPTAEPSSAPSEPATPEPSEAPAPTLEPLPTEPGDPFVPPPHGEPAPGGPFVPPPHGEPNPYADSPQQEPSSEGQSFVPQPGWPGPSVVIAPGTFTISGAGYTPGERIEVTLGRPRTDQQLLNQSTVYAGPDGSFTFNIQVAPELAGADYGLMTWVPARGGWAAEDSKRYLYVSVSPNP